MYRHNYKHNIKKITYIFIVSIVFVIAIIPVINISKLQKFQDISFDMTHTHQDISVYTTNNYQTTPIDKSNKSKDFSTDTKQSQLVTKIHPVKHFFTHALVADKVKGFQKNNGMRKSFDEDCLTPDEFKKILQELYNKGYALVDAQKVFQDGKKIPFAFPKNKLPLILSFDDINYYRKKMNFGMNEKLVLAIEKTHDNLASQSDHYEKNNYKNKKVNVQQNQRVGALRDGIVEFDTEVVTILDNFIATHDDFSYDGAKGILALTGFDGVLGYRTQSDNYTDRPQEIQRAKDVVAVLKESGWRFASHSYGHYHTKKLTDERFLLDTNKWITEVEPIIGKTNMYVFPYGEHELINKQNHISQKQIDLKSCGFEIFFGVGIDPFFSNVPYNSKSKINSNFSDKENNNSKINNYSFTENSSSLVMDRIPLDGRTMRSYTHELNKYFDVNKIYEHTLRIPLNQMGDDRSFSDKTH